MTQSTEQMLVAPPASSRARCKIKSLQPQHVCTRQHGPIVAGRDLGASFSLPRDKARGLQLSGIRVRCPGSLRG